MAPARVSVNRISAVTRLLFPAPAQTSSKMFSEIQKALQCNLRYLPCTSHNLLTVLFYEGEPEIALCLF